MNREIFEKYWNDAKSKSLDPVLDEALTKDALMADAAFFDALDAIINNKLKEGFLLGLSYATWLNECD